MALTIKKRHGGLKAHAFAEGSLYAISFTADENDTALLHQDEKVVESISRTTDGVYVLTLGPEFKRLVVMGTPNVRKNGDWTATVVPTEGNATNKLTVRTFLAGTLDDPDVTVDVVVWLVFARFNGANG